MSVIDPQDTSKSPEHYRRAWAIPAARTGNAIDYAQCVIATAKNQYQTGDRIIIDGGWLLDTAELCECCSGLSNSSVLGVLEKDAKSYVRRVAR